VKNRHILLLSSLIAAAFLTVSCSRPSQPVSENEFLLGTNCVVTIYDRTNREVFEKVFSRIREIHQTMSMQVADSEVRLINEEAGKTAVPVSADTLYVIKEGLRYSKLSDGRFDISIGPLVELWSIGTEYARIPEPEEIQAVLPLIDYRLVRIDEDASTVYLEKKGMQLDLGGIAKGYASDEARRILLEEGIEHAIIDFGGNIWAVGERPQNRQWRIGIQDPEKERGRYAGILTLTDATVVTSGIYERYFFVDGTRYHHILDPDTGYPFRNELASVSVTTTEGIFSDAVSTILFTFGLEEGFRFASRFPGLEAIFIEKNGTITLTEGIEDSFSTLE
jgi:thiamine biosynthesis lipoprotein